MLRHLMLEHVGPTKSLSVDLGDRLNVFTGDNGLGKSFLLDVCFFVMTGTWPHGRIALPEPEGKGEPCITYQLLGMGGHSSRKKKVEFAYSTQSWPLVPVSPVTSGLVIYADANGGFSAWDPKRQRPKDLRFVPDDVEILKDAYHFTPETLAHGLQENGVNPCNGLIQDWVTWYYEQSSFSGKSPFSYLEEVVSLLSHPQEPVRCGEPQRVFVNDARRYPTLEMPYGRVPFPQWPAGIRRIVSLAYMVTWAWTEHLATAKLTNTDPTSQLVILVDELECHLHPKWQRTILPALLGVAEKLAPELDIQLLVATHSPLVLASMEPSFDPEHDKLFWFDLMKQEGEVRFQDYPWAIQGDVVGWLTSDIFGLKQARSREAERAIEAAEALMSNHQDALPPELSTKEAIHEELLRCLPGIDPFWPRWIVDEVPS